MTDGTKGAPPMAPAWRCVFCERIFSWCRALGGRLVLGMLALTGIAAPVIVIALDRGLNLRWSLFGLSLVFALATFINLSIALRLRKSLRNVEVHSQSLYEKLSVELRNVQRKLREVVAAQESSSGQRAMKADISSIEEAIERLETVDQLLGDRLLFQQLCVEDVGKRQRKGAAK
jgi:hypothetical protein